MIAAGIRWIRVVMPPAGAVVAFLLSYMIVPCGYYWLKWSFEFVDAESLSMIWNFCALPVIAGAVVYGFFRAGAFHPVFRTEYRQWLSRTPWTWGQRLPLGPVHLVWQDAVILAVLVLMLLGTLVRWDLLVAAFLFAYLFSMAIAFWSTGDNWFAIALFFILGLAVRLFDLPYVPCAIVAAGYAVAWIGLNRQMRAFPWEKHYAARVLKSPHWFDQDRKQPALGWPFDSLRPFEFGKAVTVAQLMAWSLVVGWWIYVIGALAIDRTTTAAEFETLEIVGRLSLWGNVLLIVGWRLLVYCFGFRSPISIWGRLRTFRWIIPGYDYVFVAPICVILIGIAGPPLLSAAELPMEMVYAISVSLVMFVGYSMGPSFDRWMLTGDHRIAPDLQFSSKQTCEKI